MINNNQWNANTNHLNETNKEWTSQEVLILEMGLYLGNSRIFRALNKMVESNFDVGKKQESLVLRKNRSGDNFEGNNYINI